MKWIGRVLLRAFAVVGVLLVIAIVAFAILGHTAFGNQFLADQIANRISTPDMQIRIDGARGLLSGNFRVDRISVADTKGPFAEVEDVAIDWSPLDLLGAEFDASRIAAAKLNIVRAPVQTIESAPSEGSFNLPVSVDIRKVEVPSLVVGKELLGRSAEIALSGSAKGAADLLALTLDARQKDSGNARAVADLAYAVNAETLKLNLDVSEPKGGLLATMLKLPDEPAIEISVSGDGPLDSWVGKIRARLDGIDRLALDGSHIRNEAGVHQVVLSGGGSLSGLLPPTLRTLFEGETAIDVDASFAAGGMLDIRSAKLVNGSLSLDVGGSVDPEGQATLNGSLRPVDDVVELRWPLAEGLLEADIRNASLTAAGPFRSVAFEMSADVARAAVPAGRLEDVVMRLGSDRFDLSTRSGLLTTEVTAGVVAMADPQLARVVRGPVRFNAPLTIAGDSVNAERIEISSGAVGGTTSLAYDMATSAFDITFKAFAASSALLPPDLAAKAGPTIELGGKLAGTPDNLNFSDIELGSGLATAKLDGTLVGRELSASISGDVPSLAPFSDKADGRLALTAALSGPLDNLKIDSAVTSEKIVVAGRSLDNVDIVIGGQLDPTAPKGTLKAVLSLDGEPVNASTEIVLRSGTIALSALDASIGGNTLKGAIDIGPGALPAGRLRAALADLPTIGRLAGQRLEGDLDLSMELKPAGGKLTAIVDGGGSRVALADAVLNAPSLHLESADLLAQTARGDLKLASLEAGGNRIEDIALAVARTGGDTSLTLDGQFHRAPLRIAAELQQNPAGLDVLLQELKAAPRGVALSLAEPAFVLVRGGAATIESLRIALGNGFVRIDGEAGEVLDLRVALESIPASLANAFAADLATTGTIDATASITGKPTSPAVALNFAGKSLSAKPLSDAGRPPLDLSGNGTFRDNLLSAKAMISGIAEIGDLNLDAAIRLAGSKVDIEKLDMASEAVTGNLTGSVDTANLGLAIAFQVDATGKRLLPPDLASRLKAPIRLSGTIEGTPEDLSFRDIKVVSEIVTADLAGKMKAGTVDVSLTGALPDLSLLQPDADGTANIRASVTGLLSAPTVVAELAAAEAMLAGRKLQSLAVKLNAVADPKAPKGSLTATGSIDGQTIDVSGDITTEQGRIRLPALKAVIGPNTLTANLALDEALLPAGTISFNLPDIGLIAALGGQKAEGDLKGDATLDNAGGRITAAIKAIGSGLSADGLAIQAPTIDLTIPDLLTGQLSGVVKATEVTSGANRLEGLDATFNLDGARTDFSVSARYDDAPLALNGNVLRDDGALAVTIDSLSAVPRKLPVALAEPATIRIAGGVIDLGTISLNAAGGRLDISGTVSDILDIKVDAPDLPAALANIASPDLDATGIIAAHATISGTTAAPVAEFSLDGRQISAAQLRNAGREPLDLMASGKFQDDRLTLKADITGIRELGPAALTGDIVLKDGVVNVDEVALVSDPLTMRGDALLKGNNLALRLSGEIVDLGNFLPQADGRAAFNLEADGPIAALPLKLHLESENAVMAGKTLERLDIDVTATADTARPAAKVTATGRIDGQVIDADVDVVTDQGRIALPTIMAKVGANVISGSLALGDNALPTGKLTFDLPDIALLAALAGQEADGKLAGSLDLAEASGKVSATIKATGTGVTAQGIEILTPDIDVRIPNIVAAQIAGTIRAESIVSGANRLSALDARFQNAGNTTDFDVKGKYDGAPLTIAGTLESKPEGLSVTIDQFVASPRKIPVKLASPITIATGGDGAAINEMRISVGKGSITVDGVAGNTLDLRIKVAALPASLANTFASGLDASGTIAADATVTGTSKNPSVNFSVNWQSAMTSQIRAAGLSALTVTAKGKLEGTRLSINTNVRAGGGPTLDANGTVDTGGNQALNLTVKGRLPFAAIENQLATQGLALKGNASFDLKVGGNAAKPDVSGRITTANAQFIAFRQNLIVNKVAATVTLSGQTATISDLSGNLEGGGKVSASGTVGFAPGSGLPANLAIKLDRAVYADGRVVVAKVVGDLKVTGPLQRGPTLGGTIRLRRADITIPERLPASLANANVKHENAPADVARQSKEIRSETSSNADTDKGGGMNLDLKIIAPRQIFVRGRGLDAELGGEVRIAGSSNAPSVSGGFKMIRGRLSIIGKRLDFSTGVITFGGGLVPYLDMVASTTVNATTLNVNVTGLANNPSFSFTSSPALPQDEVLAQLIFGRDSSSLSPFQIAQLADAVATLAGGQRNSLFNKLRQGLGVDDLNVGTDENGGAQVTAGKYLNRRTYLELKQGEDETKSGVAINLDIGKGVKLRGEATADGNTSTGIFYEKEY